MMRFGICGISGRMGNAIVKVMHEKGFALGAAFDVASSSFYGKDPLDLLFQKKSGVICGDINAASLENVDAVIDFSAPAAALRLIDAALETKTPLVIATTGFDSAGEARLKEASNIIPIVHSTNMSVGVNLLFKLTQVASEALGSSFDAEVFEAHHRYKKDSPSGTATTLIRTIQKYAQHLHDSKEAYRERGIIGERSDKEVGVQVLRGGDIVGEHTVFFAGQGERIELTHRALDRKIFAEGAVRAAEFVTGQNPWLYSMFDVLGIG